MARFAGRYTIGNRVVEVDDWVGSQNHNWGSQHTHRYAFGQVAGFDDAPDTFLEVATAKARIVGPLGAPWATTLVLRHGGVEYSLVGLRRAMRARAAYGYYHWDFATGDDDVRISGRITGDRDDFVALRYNNPPGGHKYCLNTKIGKAELTVRHRRTGRVERLTAAHRALFEILADDVAPGIEIRA
jgi:hypothetical protein